MVTTISAKRGLKGFSLVEVTLALGIVSLAILSTVGLLGIGLEMNRDSVARTGAASVAREVVADLRMAENWTSPSPRLEITPDLASAAPVTFYVTEDGQYLRAGGVTDDARLGAAYRVDISFGPANGAAPPAMHVAVSWPTGSAGTGPWPAQVSSAYEVVASLNPL